MLMLSRCSGLRLYVNSSLTTVSPAGIVTFFLPSNFRYFAVFWLIFIPIFATSSAATGLRPGSLSRSAIYIDLISTGCLLYSFDRCSRITFPPIDTLTIWRIDLPVSVPLLGMSPLPVNSVAVAHVATQSPAAFCFPLADISQHIINASIIKIIFFIVSFDKFCCKITFYFRETHQYLYLIVFILFHYNIISPIYYIFSHYG